MKRKILYILLIITLTTTACSKQDTQQIVQFQNKLNSALYKIEKLHEEMNAIDVTKPDASAEMLDKLSKLTVAFDALADVKVTDPQYSYITSLALEGSDYMDQAYEFFEAAYGGELFDGDSADLGYQYLERATKRIRMIVTMIHEANIETNKTKE